MTGWNLPPGCTQADIDRAFGCDEECPHEEFEISWEGRAECCQCGERWWATSDEIRYQREASENYDAYVRREELRQRVRDFIDRIAFWRRWWKPKPHAIDDEVPF